MKIIERYIAKQVTVTILLVTLALMALDFFFVLINELRFVGEGNYSLPQAFAVAGLFIPTKLYLMFPWAGLIGTLLGLGLLAKHSELIAMRTASISVYRVSWAVLQAAIVLTFIVVIIGEGIAPFTEKIAQMKKTTAVSSGQTVQTLHGTWIRKKHEFVHVAVVYANNELENITRYIFDDKRKLLEVSLAKKAKMLDDGRWELLNITGTKFTATGSEQIKHAKILLPGLLDVKILRDSKVKHLERLPFMGLVRAIKERRVNHLNTTSYELALWTKLLRPLSILVMILLAVPFVFGPLRQVHMGFKVLTGILLGFVFYLANAIFSPIAVVYQLPPVLAASFPLLGFSCFGIWLMRRVR